MWLQMVSLSTHTTVATDTFLQAQSGNFRTTRVTSIFYQPIISHIQCYFIEVSEDFQFVFCLVFVLE